MAASSHAATAEPESAAQGFLQESRRVALWWVPVSDGKDSDLLDGEPDFLFYPHCSQQRKPPHMHPANSSAHSLRLPNRRLISWRGHPARGPARWFAAFLALLATLSVRAATVTWVGGSGDWSAPANWSSHALPGTNDDVVIGAGPAITVTHSSGTDTGHKASRVNKYLFSPGDR